MFHFSGKESTRDSSKETHGNFLRHALRLSLFSHVAPLPFLMPFPFVYFCIHFM